MASSERGAKGATRATDKAKRLYLICAPYLYNKIWDISMSIGRGRAMTATARQLLYMGIREWELNQLAGRIKKKDVEADYQRRLAEAQALAAQRERRKQARNKGVDAVVPAATPALFGYRED